MGRFSASLIQELEELQETGMSREEAELTLLQEKWPQGPDQWLRLLSRKSAVFWWERDLSWSLQGLHERYPISQAGAAAWLSGFLSVFLGLPDAVCQLAQLMEIRMRTAQEAPLHLLYDILCVSVDRSAGELCVHRSAFRLYHDGRMECRKDNFSY